LLRAEINESGHRPFLSHPKLCQMSPTKFLLAGDAQ
jgi:hypothetical protein